MAKIHRKMRNITECYFRIGEHQVPKIEPANLKLSALSCRNGRILTVKCQTTARFHRRSLDRGKLVVTDRSRQIDPPIALGQAEVIFIGNQHRARPAVLGDDHWLSHGRILVGTEILRNRGCCHNRRHGRSPLFRNIRAFRSFCKPSHTPRVMP